MKLSPLLIAMISLILTGAPALADQAETSRVVRVNIPKFVDDKYEIQIVLFHQSDRFHHGYALLPERDNLIHRIDVVPSKPVAWQDADGNPVEIPLNMQGNYSYRNSEFANWRQRYEDGRLKIVHPIKVAPLTWDGSQLVGTLDVEITSVDASRGGRSPVGSTHRLELNLKGSPLRGEVTSWEYDVEREDNTYGADAPRRKLAATARWEKDYWQPRPGTELTKGHSWPGSTGPNHSESARDHDGPLVSNLHDARLVWVAEDALPGGSGKTRGNFSMRTFAWTGYGDDVFGSPAVADNKVFLFTSQPAVEHLAHHPVVDENNAFYRLGIKAAVFGQKVDVITAYDARTGKRLWRHVGAAGASANRGKGTNGITPLVIGDRLIVRGAAALYAFDTSSGKVLWKRRRVDKLDLTLNNSHPSSSDASPSYIGGTIVMPVGRDGDLVGLDPKDGALRWRTERVIGHNQVPSPVTLQDKEWIIAVGGAQSKNDAPASHLIDPEDGRIAWRSTGTGHNVGNVIVHGDMLFANARNTKKLDEHRYAGFRITAKGLEKIWENSAMHRMGGRQIPVGHRGVLYADSRQTGFWAVDMKDGSVINRHPLIPSMTHDSHNWSWAIASNDRIFTSGMLMFSSADKAFKLMPGRLSLDLRGGYVCPTKPAIVDGRIFIRTERDLVCYDLRATPDQTTNIALLRARGALADGRDMELRFRDVKGGHRTLAVRIPPRHGAEGLKLNNWVAYVTRTLDWKATPVSHVPWNEKGLHGEVRLTVGWHQERWKLALDLHGNQLKGTATRSATPLDQPWDVKGTISGRSLSIEKRRVYELELGEAMSRVGPKDKLHPISLVVIAERDSIIHAWAHAGGVNSNNHEVDFSSLKLADNQLKGTFTILFHDDLHVDVHPDNDLLAATFTIEVKLDDAKVAGRFTGRIGTEWSREFSVEGRLGKESIEDILSVASGAPPTYDHAISDGEQPR